MQFPRIKNSFDPTPWLEAKEIFRERCENKQASKESHKVTNYRAGLFIEWLIANEITPDSLLPMHIDKYLAGLKSIRSGKPLTQNTRHGHARIIKCFTRYLVQNKLMPPDFKFEMPPMEKKLPEYLNNGKVEALLKLPKSTFEDAVIHTFLQSGMRRAELPRLNYGHIKWLFDQQIARLSVLGKGNKRRTTYIRYEAYHFIQLDAIERRLPTGEDDPIFVNPLTNERIKSRSLDTMMMNISERVGFKVRSHILRHTFARCALMDGLPINALQQLLGHADILTTMIYLSLLPDDIEDHFGRVYGKNNR